MRYIDQRPNLQHTRFCMLYNYRAFHVNSANLATFSKFLEARIARLLEVIGVESTTYIIKFAQLKIFRF